MYGGLTLSGQGQTTLPDINTQDVGSNVFLRNYFEAQELTTDEAIIGWNDHDLLAYHNLNWTPDGYYDKIMYDRVFFEVAACNEFIREVNDTKIAQFASDSAELRNFRNEARFLRALSYWEVWICLAIFLLLQKMIRWAYLHHLKNRELMYLLM